MSDELTIELNGKEYNLTDAFKETVERRAEGEFSENKMFDCWWDENERGDPILNIETEGYWVPWDRLERLEFEMEEVSPDGDTDNSDDQETEDLDGGGGVKSVPKDEVDLDRDDEPHEEEQPPDDTTFMMTHPEKVYVPQPEGDDPEKLPPDPEELPEDPSLVAWVPESGRTEVWSTGKALVPSHTFLEWNVQLRADEVIDEATKIVPDEDGHVKEVPKMDNHDHWESIAQMNDCEVVGEEQPNDTPPDGDTDDPYPGKQPDETLDGKYGGRNWDV